MYYNESPDRFQSFFLRSTFQIFPRVLEETCNDRNDDQTDRKCCDDRNRLQTADRIFGKDQCDREQNEQNRPECTHTFIRFLIHIQLLIRIRRNNHRQRVKRCRIESDHRHNKDQKSQLRQRQRMENFQDRC